MKALFSLASLFDTKSLAVSEKNMLFESMIAAIMNCGYELWGIHKAPKYVTLETNVARRQQTPHATAYGELGRFPMLITHK
jgi:hypothetical protein